VLSHFGSAAFDEREFWFQQVASLQDDGLLERKAYFLADQGKIEEARAMLEQTTFEKVHQRYERSELWRRLMSRSKPVNRPAPVNLGEDDLAVYGSYRVHNISVGENYDSDI
jgi:hypothetical protein